MFRPRESRPNRDSEIKKAIDEVSATFEGHAYFIPSPDIVGAAMGRTRGTLSSDVNYKQKIEELTGLKVLHVGIVLGDPNEVTMPNPSPGTIERMRSVQETLYNQSKRKVAEWVAEHGAPAKVAGVEITESPE